MQTRNNRKVNKETCVSRAEMRVRSSRTPLNKFSYSNQTEKRSRTPAPPHTHTPTTTKNSLGSTPSPWWKIIDLRLKKCINNVCWQDGQEFTHQIRLKLSIMIIIFGHKLLFYKIAKISKYFSSNFWTLNFFKIFIFLQNSLFKGG